METPAILRSFFSSKKAWGWVSLIVGAACWVIGDGHGLGVNPPISDAEKLGITLLGWPFMIDGVRSVAGRQSFMIYVYRYSFYLACCLALGGLATFLLVWIYQALSMKALVALGLIAAIALLVFILRELRASRS